VARYTRHQLKEDKFAVAVQEQMAWGVEHRNLLTVIGAIAALLVLAVAGGFFYLKSQDEKASVVLSAALRTYGTPLRPAGAPENPNVPSFTASKDRAAAAQKEFRRVLEEYPHTRSAEFARYWVGVTAMDMGDYKSAEQQLQALAGARHRDLAALSKFALASVYRAENKEGSAIELYKQLIEHPTPTVPKSTAQMELAALYEPTQPAEAAKIYEQIRKDDPTSIAARYASARLKAANAQ